MSLAGGTAAAAAALAALGVVDLLAGLRLPRGRLRNPLGPLGRAVLAIPTRVAPPATLADRIAAAGEPGGLSAREWMGLKCGCAAAAGLAAAVVAGSLPGRLWLVALAAAPAAGFLLPDFGLARVARDRADAALRELPGMLDLLRVTVAAGRAPIAAMGMIGARFDGPLAAEWRSAAAQVALGVSHASALESIARRLPAEAVRTLVDTLVSANRRGLPLADALAAQAAAARDARSRQVREQAARAAPKMQLVVAMVLVPSVMLTLGAVLAAELTGTGLGLDY